jgi:hypothetical protein
VDVVYRAACCTAADGGAGGDKIGGRVGPACAVIHSGAGAATQGDSDSALGSLSSNEATSPCTDGDDTHSIRTSTSNSSGDTCGSTPSSGAVSKTSSFRLGLGRWKLGMHALLAEGGRPFQHVRVLICMVLLQARSRGRRRRAAMRTRPGRVPGTQQQRQHRRTKHMRIRNANLVYVGAKIGPCTGLRRRRCTAPTCNVAGDRLASNRKSSPKQAFNHYKKDNCSHGPVHADYLYVLKAIYVHQQANILCSMPAWPPRQWQTQRPRPR